MKDLEQDSIIFLDIDGVLNSLAFIKEPSFTGGLVGIDPKAVAHLNRLVEATEACIVISSTWRILDSLKSIRRDIRNAGGSAYIQIIDKTPTGGPFRGNEIQRWLDAHPNITNFIILDDDSDMEHLTPYLIQTNWETGLQDKHVEAAIKMLKDKE